jgi:succinate dehydrogenase / fumarate reductase cytochrome b subunit
MDGCSKGSALSTLAPAETNAKQTQPGPPSYAQTPGLRHFWLRRVHSLLGLAFGAYITVHLIVNATGLVPRDYQMNVDKIHSLEPMLPFIEIATIFIPLLVHALYGIYIAYAGVKFNTTKYNYGGNVRYTLQRWTAVLLLAFIAFHIATLHKWGFHLVYQITHLPALKGYEEMGLFNAHNQAFQSTVSGIRYFWNDENPWNAGNVAVMAFYLLGVWSAVFHWANGLWTSAIAWGLTVTAASQRRWGHVCLAFGIVMMVVGTMAWSAFTIAPAARGDLNRWDESTHTLPEDSAIHDEDQGMVMQNQEQKKESTPAPVEQP